MSLNQFITLSVFFQSFTFSFLDIVVFVFCSMGLLILPNSYFAGFSILVVERFKKFFLWSFSVVKLLLVLLISILSMILTSIASLTRSLFISVVVCLFVFLFFHVIAFSFVFDVLLAAVKVLHKDHMSSISLARILWNLQFYFRNLRLFLILLNLPQIALNLLLAVDI